MDGIFIPELLKCLEKHSSIWDVTIEDFRDPEKTNIGYKDLLEVANKYYSDYDMSQLKKKIVNIRVRHRNEIIKIRESKQYTPRLWWFHLTRFLDKTIPPREGDLSTELDTSDAFHEDDGEDSANGQIMIELIKCLKKNNLIWDRNCEDFKNAQKRKDSYNDLLQVMRKYDSTADMNKVRRKIENIKMCHRRELKKMKESEEYIPRLWWFHLTRFLDDSEESKDEDSTATLNTSESLREENDEGAKNMQLIPELLQCLEKHPSIWDPSSEDFKIHRKTNVGYNDMLEIMKKYYSNAHMYQLKKKISNIRGAVRIEHHKMRESKKYKPRLWWFHLARFLEKTIQPKKGDSIPKLKESAIFSEDDNDENDIDNDNDNNDDDDDNNGEDSDFRQKKLNTLPFLEILKGFENRRLLWDPTCKDYGDRIKRDAAYNDLLQIMRKHRKDADIPKVKKKIFNIRDAHRRELRIMQYSKDYVPHLWWFPMARFLDKSILMSLRNSKKRVDTSGKHNEVDENKRSLRLQNDDAIFSQENMSSRELHLSTDTMSTDTAVETLEESFAEILSSNLKNVPDSNNVPPRPASTFSLETPTTVWLSNFNNSTILEEEDPFGVGSEDTTTFLVEESTSEDDDLLASTNTTLRKNSKYSAGTANLRETTRSKLKRMHSGKNKDVRSQENSKRRKQASDKVERSTDGLDDCGIYGDHVAMKLRQYSKKTVNLVQHYINNILYQADMDLLVEPKSLKK